MGAIVKSKTFKSGNSVAVRLPRELGIDCDVAVTIERAGDVVTIRPDVDPAEEKRKLTTLIDELRALGPIVPVGKRQPIEIPERRGP